MLKRKLNLLGYASGLGGSDPGSAEGPLVLQHSAYMTDLAKIGLGTQWQTIIHTEPNGMEKIDRIADACNKLAHYTNRLTNQKQFFLVLGGDHSCAIGTWSGVAHAKSQEGDIGLVWIDAHMDSHTHDTSITGNIHGMPLAALLGQGNVKLTHIFTPSAKLKPENVCLIGVRSYESGEAALLKQLGVRVFFIEEVKQRGLAVVFKEAVAIATQRTRGYGISIDMDSLDPLEAPGTGTPEPNGISAEELIEALKTVSHDKRLLAGEMVEFDPHHDRDQRTEKLIPKLITAMMVGKPC